jgi:hypothetical protein
MRSPLKDRRIFPPIESGPLKTWIGVGGSPDRWSAQRTTTCRLRSPSSVAIPNDFGPMSISISGLSRNSADRSKIAVHSPGHIAETDARAREEYWVGYKGIVL